MALASLFFLPSRGWGSPLSVALTPTRIEFGANPGDRLTGTVYFWNGTDEGLAVHVEAEDIRQGDEEGHVAREAQDPANSLKDWLKPEFPSLTVFPKQKIGLDFTIDIPLNADPGTHWGGLAVSTVPKESGGGASTQARVGTILLVTVYGDAKEQLSLESFTVPKFIEAPPLAIEARFKNEGTVHEEPQGMIQVRNIFGQVVAVTQLPERNVLPGAIRKVSTKVGEGTWFGRYTVTLNARYGNRANGAEVKELRAEARFWAVPWKTHGPWVMALAILAGLVRWQKRRFKAAWHVLKTGNPPAQMPQD